MPDLNKANAGGRDAVTFGPFYLAPAARLLERDGVAVPLGGRALEILLLLIERAGQTVSKRELIARAWPDVTVDEGSLRFHIAGLRKALGDGEAGARYVTNVPGRGYCFVAPVMPAQPAPPPNEDGAAGRTHGLPAPLFRMIGRDDTVGRIAEQLLAHRFVNIVGPGGIGKTTVAVSVTHGLVARFAGAIHFIGLAALNDPNLVNGTVAHALGMPVNAANAIPSLVDFLRERQMLLVFDNCEHVIEAVSFLGESLFMGAPRVHILATSREPMRVEGEHVHRLFPLDYPPDDNALTAEEALDFPAVQLFMERVAAHSDRPPLSDGEAVTVGEICRKLDGMPLALEFAAARAATLGVFEVAAHLNDRFAFLTKGRRTALPRHQTLRATLDWSYELLPEPERRFLRRLAIFSGGFTREAATAVTSGDGYEGPQVIEAISNLVSKSLVTLDSSAGASRWRLLETTRAYALEKLGESDERDEVARRHAKFFRDFFGAIETATRIETAAGDLDRYRRDIDNVRAALDWSFSPVGDPAIGVALTAAHTRVWHNMMLYSECIERTEQALNRLGTGPEANLPLRLQLLFAHAVALIFTMAPVDRTKEVLVSGLAIAERLDDIDAQLWILWALWALQLNIGECREARSTAERFGQVAPRAGDPSSILAGRRLLGTAIQFGGDQHEACRRLKNGLESPYTTEDPLHPAWPHDHRVLTRATLARTLWLQGFADQAQEHARESLEETPAELYRFTRFEVLRLAVCPIAILNGDIAAGEHAVAMLAQITASTDTDFWKVVARCFEGKLLIKRGAYERGLAVLGAVLETCDTTGWRYGFPEFLGARADGLAGLGRHAEAIVTVDRALAVAEDGGERWYVAELLRSKGAFLLQQGGGNAMAAAEGCFRAAQELAQQQGALAWELRSARSLAALKADQGRRDEARSILAPVYQRFTEGFESADLSAARALLATL
jgi:predicted ATPase/DNA-binding winged helix-turn-helix (wHTH) protein